MGKQLRIFASSHTWLGANDYSYVTAFRRAGHTTHVFSGEEFFPSAWRSTSLRALRRVLSARLIREYQRAFVEAARAFEPDLIFVYKGPYIDGTSLQRARGDNAVAINVYPDIGLADSGPYLLNALPGYDWIFDTKSFRLDEMIRKIGRPCASFLPHAYDADVHCPIDLHDGDLERYGCDISFVGAWSPKKERYLLAVRRALPNLRMKIWGNNWKQSDALLAEVATGRMATGQEYAKAITASKISVALLVERLSDWPQGDVTTARTFEIPGAGGFMLHERTQEAQRFFIEDEECAMFGDEGELVDKIRHYAVNEEARSRIATAGRQRATRSGYSYDARAGTVVEKAVELIAERRNKP